MRALYFEVLRTLLNTVVCILDRHRHKELISNVRQTGARIGSNESSSTVSWKKS